MAHAWKNECLKGVLLLLFVGFCLYVFAISQSFIAPPDGLNCHQVCEYIYQAWSMKKTFTYQAQTLMCKRNCDYMDTVNDIRDILLTYQTQNSILKCNKQ